MYLLVITTWAPSLDNMVDIPLPNPVPPPVTKAVLPLNAPSGNIGVNLAGYIFAWSPTWLAGDVEKHFLCKNKITMQNIKIKILF